MKTEELRQMQVRPDVVLREAMKQMDACGWKCLLVVDERGKFSGLLTDGEIRRRIIADGHLDGKVADCYNRTPITVGPETSVYEIKKIMTERKIEIIPSIDNKLNIIDLLVWANLFSVARAAREPLGVPVVIMAGGKGTRLAPVTNVLPKPLVPMGHEPIIDLIMKRFHESGVDNFYVTVNYKKELIRAYLLHNQYPFRIHVVDELEYFGTAGSLRLLPDIDSNDIFVTNCDILVDTAYRDILDFHREYDNDMTLVGSLQNYRIPYGIIDFSPNGKVERIREKPEMSFTINTGIYLLKKNLIRHIEGSKVFHMTDLINKVLELGLKVSVFPVSEKAYTDMGQWEQYHSANDKLKG